MAIQDQGQGQFQEVVGVLKRRTWQIFLPAAFLVVLGLCVAKLLPRKYMTRTGIELRETTLPIGGAGYDDKSLQRDIKSTSWQIKQMERVRRVVERLEWSDFTALDVPAQHEYVRDMITRLNVKVTGPTGNVVQGSNLIEIEYTDSDPQRAEQFLNRLRETYTAEVIERFRNDARAALDILQNSRKDALNNLVAREQEATEIKKRHNVSVTQQAPGGGRQRDEDPVFTMLNDKLRQHMDVEVQLAVDQAALATLTQQFDSELREIPESEVSGGETYEKELEDIATTIAAFRETQEGLRPPHSLFQDAELKIARLEGREEALRERISLPTTQQNLVRNPRRDELQEEIQDKELEIKQAEALLAQLGRDITSLNTKQADRAEVFREIQRLDSETAVAAKNYDAASDSFNKQKRFVDLIMQGYSNPFEVTELARTPNSPTSPNQPLIIAAAAALGLALGLMSALAAEYGKNAFRGVADVTRTLSAPVLGMVNEIVTERQVAHARLRRFLVVTSTFALMAAMLWITWAFEHRPRWLGSNLTQAIEGVREMFR